MLRLYGDARARGEVAHHPSAIVAEPLNECRHGVGRALFNARFGEIAGAIRVRHGQSDHAGLLAGVVRAAFERQVIGNGAGERRIDEGLDGAGAARACGHLPRGDARARKRAADAAEEARVGAAEAVDGLLRVAHHVELAGRRDGFPPIAFRGVGGGEEKQNFGLERIGILKLVDENALIILLQLGACTVVLKQVAGVEKQIQEIELARAPFALLIDANHFP